MPQQNPDAEPAGGQFDVIVTQASVANAPESYEFPAGPVYTVYLQLGEGVEWAVQYGVLGAEVVQNGRVVQMPNAPAVVPPYPLSTQLPADLARSGSPTYVSGVLGEDGTLHDLRTVGQPRPDSGSVISAMAQWHFRPARSGSDIVSLQVLIAVPGTDDRGVKADTE